MNFEISGKQRRALKKELRLLKYSKRMFWFYEDINRVYGCGHDDQSCNDNLKRIDREILDLENKLNTHATK